MSYGVQSSRAKMEYSWYWWAWVGLVRLGEQLPREG